VQSPYKAHLCSCCGVWFFSMKELSTKIAWVCTDCAMLKWMASAKNRLCL
jgi:hypothetical protein